ncbi:MAG: hypothetical protein H6564_00005 [Lewinellaceae bacterium]|nr:hypothetical protein [Lewinellaceae bacterium]
MDQLGNSHTELAGKEIQFRFGYQRRSNKDLFKIFIIENRKSLRGYKRVALIGIPLILVWLLTKNLIALIVMAPFALLILIGLIGYSDIWRVRKKWENQEIPRRAFVKERTLRYGSFGIIYYEIDKHGQFQEKYAWSRFKSLIEWGTFIFLLPAKEKADVLVIRADEIGADNFSAFRDYAKSKLMYKSILSYKEII